MSPRRTRHDGHGRRVLRPRLATVRALALAAVLSTCLTGCLSAHASSAAPDYARSGPFDVVTAQMVGPTGAHFDLFRPSSYAALSFPSPIVTWGNGTGADPADYGTLLTHLASWGFTVIASTLPDTGSGQDILAAAHLLVDADRHAGSPFFHRLATDEVGAVGHSQGATGAVRAAELGGSFVSTVLTFSLPWNGHGPIGSVWDQPPGGLRPLGWSFANPDCPTALDCWADPARLHQPTFLVSTRGPLDAVIANPAVERCYFEEVDASAALGIVRTSDGRIADHNSVQDAADGGNPGAFLGYATAWLEAELRHDARAAGLFFGPHPSLVGPANWAGSQVKRTPSVGNGCA